MHRGGTETPYLLDVFQIQGTLYILFICQHQKSSSDEFLKKSASAFNELSYLFLKQGVQLSLAVLQSTRIRAVYNPDNSVGLLEVIPPVRTKRALAANIPHIHFFASSVRTFAREGKKRDRKHACNH